VSNLQNSIDDDFKRNTIRVWPSKERVENVFYYITSRGNQKIFWNNSTMGEVIKGDGGKAGGGED